MVGRVDTECAAFIEGLMGQSVDVGGLLQFRLDGGLDVLVRVFLTYFFIPESGFWARVAKQASKYPVLSATVSLAGSRLILKATQRGEVVVCSLPLRDKESRRELGVFAGSS